MRRKWSPAGRRYLRLAESIAARRASDALVTDGGAMRTYYLDRYGRDSRHISYGARIVEKADSGTLDRWNLKTGRYLLAVGRLEPENNLDVIVREFLRSGSKRELLIVGGAPYDTAFVRGLRAMERPGSVRFLGPVYDANFLENLYAGAFACVHGHEVGGTNPSLVRAMGAGASVLALDTRFNRETLGGAGVLWSAKEGELASALSELEGDPSRARELGEMARTRASTEFTWESVIRRHEELFRDLAEARKGTGDSR
jgi:glycosyltransferase involved in cell wall biosynthesis